ncbi:MAG: mannitol dehydrogenase family protein [Pseudomonadota bacterium]|nr:mannitol dehydrogenase family protein [Pseudomonadota bacterium]
MTIQLNQSNLASMPDNVSVPGYDRAKLSAGILHIGIGNFHRSHQAIYLDKLFEQGKDHDWALVGCGVKSFDAAMRDKLAKQDWLTTVVELDEDALSARVCGSMIDFLNIDANEVIAALCRPEIRIVSLTITEGGYFIDAKTGGFHHEHPDIQADIANPQSPKTVFGILLEGLKQRRAAGLEPFTIMTCDNVPHNGDVTRQTLTGLAKLIDEDIAAWISSSVAFPNSMVDCITPATTAREIERLVKEFGVEDASPVFCEPFRQWVIEDNFPQGRPALEEVGVEFVDDVTAHEFMKLRILNGGHAALAFPSALLGLEFVHEGMLHPLVRDYVRKMVIDEAIPTLNPVPGTDFNDYLDLIESRFANPEIGDTVARLCTDPSNRLPKFILPITQANVDSEGSITGTSLVIALWCRYCAYTADAANNTVLNDEQASRLQKLALEAKNMPEAFLGMDDVFGPLGKHPRFVAAFSHWLNKLWTEGTKACLEAYIAGKSE